MSQSSLLDAPSGTLASAAAGEKPRGLDRLLGLEIPVTVCFGEKEIVLKDLASLAPGSILELDRSAAAPVDLMVNSQVVARGTLLLVDEHYAVRITEVVSTGERIKSLAR